MTDDDTIYTARANTRSVYHVDADCPHVRRMANPKEWTQRGPLEDLEPCDKCAGGSTPD